MNNNDLVRQLGLDKITLQADDEYLQLVIQDKIDKCLKDIEKENEKEKLIDFLKDEHNKYEEKEKFLDMLFDTYVYNKIKNRLIRDGFVYQCKFC